MQTGKEGVVLRVGALGKKRKARAARFLVRSLSEKQGNCRLTRAAVEVA
ncbi:MAG: hypothetical protein V8S26_05930 [Lachnospiraceae bacterium]